MSNDIKLINYVNNVEGNRKRIINYTKEYIPSTPNSLSLTEAVTAFNNAMTTKYSDDTAVETTHEVRFFDIDGTLLKTETVEHLGTTTPPADPTYDSTRLTFQCWGCAIGDNVFGPLESDMDYMAVYKPTNDITYIFLDVDPAYNTDLAVSIPVNVITRRIADSSTAGVARKLYVDWGDNSAVSVTEFSTTTTYSYKPYYFTHTYAEAGSYEIKIYPDEGIRFSKYWASNISVINTTEIGKSKYFEETSGSTFFWALEEGMLARSGTGNPTVIVSGQNKNRGIKKIYTRALAVAYNAPTNQRPIGYTNYTPNLDVLLISDQIVNLYTGWNSSNAYYTTQPPALLTLISKNLILPAYLSNYWYDNSGTLVRPGAITIATTDMQHLIFRTVSSDDPNKKYAGFCGLYLKGTYNTKIDKLIFPDALVSGSTADTSATKANAAYAQWIIYTEDMSIKKYINYSPYPVILYRTYVLDSNNNRYNKLTEYHNTAHVYIPPVSGTTLTSEVVSSSVGRIAKWPTKLIYPSSYPTNYQSLGSYLGQYNPVIDLNIVVPYNSANLLSGARRLIVPVGFNLSIQLQYSNLSLENWVHLLNNVADLSGATAKTIQIYTATYVKHLIWNYVKYNDETEQYELCNSTDTGAITIKNAFNAKNWTISYSDQQYSY